MYATNSNLNDYQFLKATRENINDLLRITAELKFDQWPETKFHELFDYDIPVYLIMNGAEIAGFIVYIIYLDEIRILNITVAKKYQNSGYGRALMEHALANAVDENAQFALLETRVDSFVALKLYTNLGFKILCVRKDYYTDVKVQDAYFMQLDLRLV